MHVDGLHKSGLVSKPFFAIRNRNHQLRKHELDLQQEPIAYCFFTTKKTHIVSGEKKLQYVIHSVLINAISAAAIVGATHTIALFLYAVISSYIIAITNRCYLFLIALHIFVFRAMILHPTIAIVYCGNTLYYSFTECCNTVLIYNIYVHTITL